MASPLSLPIPASPRFGSWLQGLATTLAFSTNRANRLVILSTTEPADGSSNHDHPANAPLRKLHKRLLEGRFQMQEGGDRLDGPTDSFTTRGVNTHAVGLGTDDPPIFMDRAFRCLATLARLCTGAPWAAAAAAAVNPAPGATTTATEAAC